MYIFNSDGELNLNEDNLNIFDMLYALELKEQDMLSEAEIDEIIYGEN